MRQNQCETLGSRYLSGGDYHQTAESAVKNKDASDRVKAAQALGLAAKGYTAYTDVAAGGALIRVESGSGFSHKRETTDAMSEFSLGNSVNAKDILSMAREGIFKRSKRILPAEIVRANGKRTAEIVLRYFLTVQRLRRSCLAICR
ncbi:hypothetical protein [Rodentibacter caecimuris]|uniref:hypothetical protein n=2 Tax=Rodentibacter caecimuris TaxID=1796644 RepID=UPI002248DF5C|nr:hypothetical protein [Rodentibacter heylii]MCX2960508.1 hypothetical protein [Rodentibacter heylii]